MVKQRLKKNWVFILLWDIVMAIITMAILFSVTFALMLGIATQEERHDNYVKDLIEQMQ